MHDNLVRVLGDKRFFYDGHGRLIRKLAGQHTDQHFVWDDENRLTEVITTRRPGTAHAITQTTRFDYDALGRRVAKHDAFGATAFIWEGMRLIEERRGSSVISYVYEPGSYVPIARLDALGEHTAKGGIEAPENANLPLPSAGLEQLAKRERGWGEGQQAANDESASSITNPSASRAMSDAEARYWASLEQTASEALDETIEKHWGGEIPQPEKQPELVKAYYFHNSPVGLPEELTNAQGQIVWQASYKTWGNTVSEVWEYANLDGTRVFEQDKGDMPDEEVREQNLRFQGQYLDRDTGLHYNTFRYYDPDLGRFISPDPIGLMGGINLHSYAPNPISWIDPWGWNNIPHGFSSYGQFQQFGQALQAGLSRAGFQGAVSYMQGSAVTGRSYETKVPFDVGRISDFDIAVSQQDLYHRAEAIGIAKNGRTEPIKLGSDAAKNLGINDTLAKLSRMSGREVNVMIFDNTQSIKSKAKSIRMPGKFC